jgi:regulator of nonsense transcripts 1
MTVGVFKDCLEDSAPLIVWKECYEEPELPAHACAYCNTCAKTSVAKCFTCSKWFCNGSFNTPDSHIVHHLAKSKHKVVSRFGSSKDSTLKCLSCGARNVFVLGSIPCNKERVLICRDSCLAAKDIGSRIGFPTLDTTLWEPLIEERAFVSWLVKKPESKEETHFSPLTHKEIQRLEGFWRNRPEMTAKGMLALKSNNGQDHTVCSVTTHFENASKYKSVFSMLVALEQDSARLREEGPVSRNVSVKWIFSKDNERLGFFRLNRDEYEAKVTPGEELVVSLSNFDRNSGKHGGPGCIWKATGYVVRVLPGEEVCLKINPDDLIRKGPWTHNGPNYQINQVRKSATHQRQLLALRILVSDNMAISATIKSVLLGQNAKEFMNNKLSVKIPGSLVVPNFPRLNSSQRKAVVSALTSPISIIVGPPGTGKTLTCATILYHLAKCSKSGRILVCAPSNTACDHLTGRLHLSGIKVIRMVAKSREDVASPVEGLTLHTRLKEAAQGYPEFLKLFKLKQTRGRLSAREERRYREDRRRIELNILESADIVCCTCVSAGDARLSKVRFEHVLIDEATQATEPECLIPLVKGAKQVILVGDNRQLGPIVLSSMAAKAGLTQSLFERMTSLGIPSIRLDVQYRMHPVLAKFPSKTFYQGTLQNGVPPAERRVDHLNFPWPRKDMPMFFYHSAGKEEISGTGTSYLNRAEGANVERVVIQLITAGLKGSQIGVITPYEGQRAYIQSILDKHERANLLRDVDVSSVDGFQGREKDYIILSCVRSNAKSGIGFLDDARRMNVSITRAKFGLICCGNAHFIGKAPSKNGVPSPWASFLAHMFNHALVVEGPLSKLKRVTKLVTEPGSKRK